LAVIFTNRQVCFTGVTPLMNLATLMQLLVPIALIAAGNADAELSE
jgi:hypothetical protein